MDGHTGAGRRWTKPRLQTDSPSHPKQERDLCPGGLDLCVTYLQRRTVRRSSAELRLMVLDHLLRWLRAGTGSGDIQNCSSDPSQGGRSLSTPTVSCRDRSTNLCHQRAHRRALSPNDSRPQSRRFTPSTCTDRKLESINGFLTEHTRAQPLRSSSPP
jgi:hypothetical protein